MDGQNRTAGTRIFSRGVHEWRGRWLVNGSGEGVLRIDLSPGQRARVVGVPVGLRELLVSVDDPPRLASALRKVSGFARRARLTQSAIPGSDEPPSPTSRFFAVRAVVAVENFCFVVSSLCFDARRRVFDFADGTHG